MTLTSRKVTWDQDREVYSLQEWDGSEWLEIGCASHGVMTQWAYAFGYGPQWEMTWRDYRVPGGEEVA